MRAPADMHIEAAGADALIVYLDDACKPVPGTVAQTPTAAANPATAARVQAACTAIDSALGPELVELLPSYASVLVIYDPLQSDYDALRRQLRQALAALPAGADEAGPLVTLPAWYSTESGPDLARLAARAGLTAAEVIAIHQATEYRVYAIGFAPGFAYLGTVDARIAAPRLDTPRPAVPRGAVAIADRQTAVYPSVSPGGWNLIGLCPTTLFDPAASPIMPISVGDRVRFTAIERDRFLALGGSL